MNPEWVMVGVAALGIAGHLLLSARDRGRWEQRVDDLKEDLGMQRAAIGACQLAEHCEQQMDQMGDRVRSAHKRMDGQDARLDRHDDLIRELDKSVAELKVVKA